MVTPIDDIKDLLAEKPIEWQIAQMLHASGYEEPEARLLFASVFSEVPSPIVERVINFLRDRCRL
jgi:hypothetical protein